jgi:hypothetical protein
MMGQIYGQNQQQAGNAYARAQQRMYDLQQQGLDKGFDETKHWYQAGQEAQDRYGNTVKDLQDGEGKFYDQQGKFRDELGGYADNILGVDSALNADRLNINMTGADIDKGNVYAGTGREQNALNQKYGGQQQASDTGFANYAGAQDSKLKTFGSLAGLFTGMYGANKGAGG